jgi:hypothetical protein
MLQWWIGDWWIFGSHRYGERKQQVETWDGPSFQTCEAYGWVCARFETLRRRKVLSFTHHREVAALDPAEADLLLDWCVEGVAEGNRDRRSVHQLRQEIRRRQWARAQVKTPVVAIVDLGPRPRLFPEVKIEALQFRAAAPVPPLQLDTSTGGGAVPAELAQLSEEPPPLDRSAIARAALVALPFDEWFTVMTASADDYGYDLVKRAPLIT